MHSPLSINNICKSFKEHLVLNDISFEVQQNEIFGLIGLNGAGKTTMIKIILNLLNSDSGMASFFGADIRNPQSRSNICYLPEKFYPSQFLQGDEFLALSLSYYGKNYDKEKVHNLAHQLDLDPAVLKQKISKYSKGMGQKLGLLSVFLSEAPLLILDEPMSGLDPSARIQLKRLLIDYSKSGKSVFFSSHILSDLDEICDRIAVLDQPNLIFVGKPSEFKQQNGNVSLEESFIRSIKLAA